MGEVVYTLCYKVFKLSENTAKFIMYTDLIVSASIITGFGYYDKIGKVAGAGTIIPITGFANSITSSAVEAKPEGIFCGIFMNVFKLAGSVIASGIVSGIFVGLIKYLVELL
jgi:stage V sporulation protein AC